MYEILATVGVISLLMVAIFPVRDFDAMRSATDSVYRLGQELVHLPVSLNSPSFPYHRQLIVYQNCYAWEIVRLLLLLRKFCSADIKQMLA